MNLDLPKEQSYTSRNLFKRWYFNKRIEIAKEFAKISSEDTILDFGCGDAKVFHNLQCKVIGYDIVEKDTDVKDYTKIIPTKIFAMDVFEHLEEPELRAVINNFKTMNKDLILITSIPFGSFLTKSVRVLLGYKPVPVDHKLTFKQVKNVISEYFELLQSKNILGLSHIAKWRFKN